MILYIQYIEFDIHSYKTLCRGNKHITLQQESIEIHISNTECKSGDGLIDEVLSQT